MKKIYELIYLDMDKIQKVSLFELAQVYGSTVEILETICREHGIGMITESGFIYIDTEAPSYSNGLKLLKTYAENTHIEEDMIKYIKANPNCTVPMMQEWFELSREKIVAVLDEITFRHGELYSDWERGAERLYWAEV